MGEKKIERARENYEGTWDAMGKTFKRKGQAEKFIRQCGFKAGKAMKYGTRWWA
jgi:hypothetical protein